MKTDNKKGLSTQNEVKILLTQSELKEVVKRTAVQMLNETSRRQKAVSGFIGKNNKIKTFGIITGENPMGRKLPQQENTKRNEMLRSYLQSRQFVWFPVKGKYGNTEHPFMIYNCSIEDLKTIGRTFDQESFIFAEVRINADNAQVVFSYYQKFYPETAKTDEGGKKLKPSEKDYQFIESKSEFVTLDNDVDDFFTSIGRNFKFTIPFDIFLEQVESVNKMILERCSKYEQYQKSHERLISESISDELTFNGRRLRRAQLYGTHYENFLKC